MILIPQIQFRKDTILGSFLWISPREISPLTYLFLLRVSHNEFLHQFVSLGLCPLPYSFNQYPMSLTTGANKTRFP